MRQLNPVGQWGLYTWCSSMFRLATHLSKIKNLIEALLISNHQLVVRLLVISIQKIIKNVITAQSSLLISGIW